MFGQSSRISFKIIIVHDIMHAVSATKNTNMNCITAPYLHYDIVVAHLIVHPIIVKQGCDNLVISR